MKLFKVMCDIKNIQGFFHTQNYLLMFLYFIDQEVFMDAHRKPTAL